MDDLSKTIADIVVRNKVQSRIKPTWVANEAMIILDPGRVSISSVYNGCLMHACQIARELLRKQFEKQPEETSQHHLFPELQWRYPVEHTSKSEPEYVLLEDMTDADIKYNVSRLRTEAETKLKHADALEEFGRKRQSREAS